MSVLVLIGLMMTCAKLWSDVAALRERIVDLEGEAARFQYPEISQPDRSQVREIRLPEVPVAAVAPEFDTAPAQIFAADPPPPPPPAPPPPLVRPRVEPPTVEAIGQPVARGAGFEDLFGRKLPIWAGGITLAVAGFLIVKYSIEAGLLSPVVRIVLGLMFGSVLIACAEAALRADDRVRDPRVRQALSGAGIATLYVSILAAANLYHLIGPVTAFVGMALTTVLAGGLSLRFGAPSAILGLLGGLAAPALVGSGTPDVPLLSAYLALTVGGLCALSRSQRWVWLGVAALIGGFGWSALLLLGGALDLPATLSIGIYALLLGIGLPLIAFAGGHATMVRLAGSLAACAQLAGLVAIGGFGALEWGLFGMVSIAIVWLSRREPMLVDLPAAGLAVALLLIAAWPHPGTTMLGAILCGIAVIFGLPAAYRVWRSDWRPGDAIQVAVISAAIVVLPAMRLELSDGTVAALALLGAALSAIVAMLGWTVVDRREDLRFAILVSTGATLVAVAAIVVSPTWGLAPIFAIVATGMLMLAERADDPRLDWIAPAFGASALLALLVAPSGEMLRMIGIDGAAPSGTAALRWLVPALAAIAFVIRSRRSEVAFHAQPVAVLLGYAAVSQVLSATFLPLAPIALLVALAFKPNRRPALLMAAALTAGWAALPLGTWLIAAGGAVLGVPMLIGTLPPVHDTVLRLVLPAAAAAFVAWRLRSTDMRPVATVAAALLAAVSTHICFKHLFAIADADTFVRLGMAERTLWEIILAGLALALWRRRPVAGQVLAWASFAHFAWFTLVLHDPLWTVQAVGSLPIFNLLLPAFGTAFALTWLVRELPLPAPVMRAREWMQMALTLIFATATLRQAFHGSILSVGSVGEGEDIARSALLIALGIGFLRHGIVSGKRDWRIASLALMLAAVAKVFLIDAAGLDGLLRIASFAGLGFSLIGIGWVYARYLPEDPVLTPDSEMSATSAWGN